MTMTLNRKSAPRCPGKADPDQNSSRQRREDYQTLKGDATVRVETVRIGKAILKERARPAGPKNVGLMRQREIERLITTRHGATIPDPQDTDDRETALSYGRAVAFSLTGQPIADWSARWAPWMRDDEIDAIEWEARQRGRALRADAVARLLGVAYWERLQLNLRTIGSYDLKRSKRDELAREAKKRRDRERQDRISRAAGRKVRCSDGPKPWEIAGVSRRTWYRQKAWHSNIANKSLDTTGEKSVPNVFSALEKEKNDEAGVPHGQPLQPSSPSGVNAEKKRVPRPQALVAEGSAQLGKKTTEDRTRETGISLPIVNDALMVNVARRRIA